VSIRPLSGSSASLDLTVAQVELRLFDGEDRLIAAYIDMKAMQDELDFARERERGE
jgi:uncharacterized protein (DUF952 family)